MEMEKKINNTPFCCCSGGLFELFLFFKKGKRVFIQEFWEKGGKIKTGSMTSSFL